jgi:hypothetical protein
VDIAATVISMKGRRLIRLPYAKQEEEQACVELVASKGVERGCTRELSDISFNFDRTNSQPSRKARNFHFDGQMPTER